MKTHFKNARLIDPETGTDTIGDLFIADGLIVDSCTPDDVIDCGGKCLALAIDDRSAGSGQQMGEKHAQEGQS